MKVIIVGMGRMGSGLANRLDKKGHQVMAIDPNPDSFSKLDSNFSGQEILGSALDLETLKAAEIHRVDALVCCASSDETNAVVSRVAKNRFFVPKVIARIYDSEKAEIYRHLGIQTISALDWGINRTMEALSNTSIDGIYDMGDGNVSFVRMNTPHFFDDLPIHELNVPGSLEVVGIVRRGKSFIPISGARLKSGDVLYMVADEHGIDRLKKNFRK